MNKSRVEAFSDGVFAILITIMVLELKVPHGPEISDLLAITPVFISYFVSFVYLGIYWNNHHHLFQVVHQVKGSILWANLHLLFWLSLLPFVTAWSGQNHFAPWPMASYGFILLMSGLAFTILTKLLVVSHGPGSVLAQAIDKDVKGKTSVALYLLAIGLSFVSPGLAGLVYIFVASMWLIPDRRIESRVAGK